MKKLLFLIVLLGLAVPIQADRRCCFPHEVDAMRFRTDQASQNAQ